MSPPKPQAPSGPRAPSVDHGRRGQRGQRGQRGGRSATWACLAGLLLLLAGLGPASAEVFYSKQGALDAAFPGASAVEAVNLYLSEEDAAWISQTAGARFEERVASMYLARQGEGVVGYAFIDTHPVRTLNETLMVVVTPEGKVGRVLQLAFHEPPEYNTPPAFFAQFAGRALPQVTLGEGLDGVSGATLTSRSVTAATRRVLALYERMVRGRSRG